MHDSRSVVASTEFQESSIEKYIAIDTFVYEFLKSLKNDLEKSNPSLKKFNSEYYMVKYNFMVTVENFLKHGLQKKNESYRKYLNRPLLDNHYERQVYYCINLREKAMKTLLDIYVQYFYSLTEDIFTKNYKLLNRIKSPELVYSPYSENIQKINDVEKSIDFDDKHKIKLYNIIPMPLIETLFDQLITNSSSIKKLYNTFSNIEKRTELEKLLKKYSEFEESLKSLKTTGINCNLFWGLENRGPFLPQYNKKEKELFSTFELNSLYIIKQDKYERLFSGFIRIVDYVTFMKKEDIIISDVNKEEKVLAYWTEGIEIFESLMETFEQFKELPSFDMYYWENRKLSEKELKKLKKEEKENLKDKLFWDIKKIENMKEIFDDLN